MNEQRWPDVLWLVRHGESAGNVARNAAEDAGLPLIDIATRDADTPLSELGERQSRALGAWFATLPREARPEAILCSPYVRARQTAAFIAQRAELDPGTVPVIVDERLREKEFGVLDRLTRHGIGLKFPELDAQRKLVGKFYFRPPGGESWCDVILRLRNVLDTLSRDFRCDRVLLVAHQVTVNCFRYLFDNLDEQAILDIDRAADVPNCGVTSYQYDASVGKHGGMGLRLVNFTAPLEATDTPVTTEPDKPHGPK